MGLVDIDKVGGVGLIKDARGYTLPPAAWSEARNVRFVGDEVQRIGGRRRIFGALPGNPRFLMPVSIGTKIYWLWTTNNRAYVWDGDSHEEITRESSVGIKDLYNATHAREWQGTILGGIAIINNGQDVPQYWSRASGTVLLANLPNWPANTRAEVIRAFNGFLVAVNLTIAGERHPHKVLWSSPADPGSVPESWAVNDPGFESGQTDLPDVTSGVLRDALPLRGQLFLYKEASTWRMRWIGGQYVFAFDTAFETMGVLAPRCVDVLGNGRGHFVVTQDDVVVHNGETVESVLDKRARRHLFRTIDPTNYSKSFIVSNPYQKEMWFCYPEIGSTEVNVGLLWNYENGTISYTEVDFEAAATGSVEGSDSLSWDEAEDPWDAGSTEWSAVERRKTLVVGRTLSEFWELDEGSDFHGKAFESLVRREGLAVIGRARDGTPIVDFNKRKLVTRVWPRITSRTPIEIRLGRQDDPEGPIHWTPRQLFDPTTMKYLDFLIEGAAIGIEFYSFGTTHWVLEGYKLDMIITGEY